MTWWNSFRRRQRHWQQLSPQARQVWVSALLRLPTVWLQLRLGGLKAAKASAARIRQDSEPLATGALPGSSEGALSPLEIRQIVGSAAARLPLSLRCLEQSLVARKLLHRAGHPATLRIGVKPPSARGVSPFEAHAWLEGPGLPSAEEAAPAHTPLL